MRAVYGTAYVDQLIDSRSYEAMAMLGAHMEAAAPAPDQPDLGLPPPLFVYLEALTWFAQSVRSGAWTYFEATPHPRQQAMRDNLLALDCDGWRERYVFGMDHWDDEASMAELDRWIDASEPEQESWLLQLLDTHRDRLKQLLCRAAHLHLSEPDA
ncbi:MULTISPECIES: hypothetical protein [unclassified Pseudomonas]|uniref:hypothetical protein n=1 Tax=unclassified Pseudomonas TaxID=196821 RepID=UPI000CD01684|nr:MULTISPECIES: hypothetical protein [unclassified Pseudomonas]POA50825.1 hypothetical protein C1889_29990 [Pseudomonas sp. FW507-12TSA]